MLLVVVVVIGCTGGVYVKGSQICCFIVLEDMWRWGGGWVGYGRLITGEGDLLQSEGLIVWKDQELLLAGLIFLINMQLLPPDELPSETTLSTPFTLYDCRVAFPGYDSVCVRLPLLFTGTKFILLLNFDLLFYNALFRYIYIRSNWNVYKYRKIIKIANWE